MAMLAARLLSAQTGATSTPQQAPRTAPQVREVLPSYEGQNVTSVELAGQPDLDTTRLAPLLAQRAGEPFSRSKVDESAAAIQRTGRFHAVELEIRPEPKGVRVLLVLQPAVYFGIYQFLGTSGRFPYSRLLQVADYPPRGAYTPVDVQNAQQALETFFKRSGYFRATVEPHVQVDRQHGLANVIFNVALNRRARFGDVKITGPDPGETARLQRALHGLMARLRNSSIRSGKTYSLKVVQNASQYLESTLMKQGHLGAQVKLLGAAYDPQTNRADIQFNLLPGPVVHVRLQEAHVWSWSQRKLLPLYQQAGFGAELIQEGRQNLLSYFQSKGYFDVKVDTRTEQQSSGETVFYQITKGPRHKVADVGVVGNDHLADKELMSHVEVEKGHFFTHGKYSQNLVRTSVNNLKRFYQANGFSDVKVTPHVTSRNGNLVVKFQVEEGPQDIVESLKVEGNDTQPESALAPKGLKVIPGQAYSQKLVDEDRNQIMAQYLRNGYLNATFRATADTVGGDKHGRSHSDNRSSGTAP
jgi:outer membrane protein assembly factor BamA